MDHSGVLRKGFCSVYESLGFRLFMAVIQVMTNSGLNQAPWTEWFMAYQGGVWGYQGWDHCDTPRAVGVPSGSEMATFLRSDMGAKLSKISSFQSQTSPKCNFWVRTSQNHSQPISSRKSKPNHQTKWSQPILPHLTFSFSLRPLTNFSGREVPIFADI